MEFTEKMLDSIEAIKGVRNPAYWDGRCQQHFQAQSEQCEVKAKPEKPSTASSS